MALAALCGAVMVGCSGDDNGGKKNGGDKVDPSTIAASNLVAYMSFDGNGTDLKGHAVTPKSITSANYVDGARNQAYQGATGSAFTYTLPEGDKIATAKAFTFAFWINAEAIHGAAILSLNSDSGWGPGGSFLLEQIDAWIEDVLHPEVIGVHYYFRTTEQEWGGHENRMALTAMPSEMWYHMVIMYDNATSAVKLYANGTEIWNEVRYGGPIPEGGTVEDQPLLGDLVFSGANKLCVGGWWTDVTNTNPEGGTYFTGMIDELRIYDKGLSEAEVAALYSAELDYMTLE